jgi:gluconokinase
VSAPRDHATPALDSRCARDPSPPLVVIMGVSGCGKSTLAGALAAQLGWTFIEGDDCHPRANRERMASGLPLDDQMREPWVAEVSRRVMASDGPVLLSFSGLRSAHREHLRGLRAHVLFIHLELPKAMLEHRLRQRTGHFMPPNLLDSQLEALEPVGNEKNVVILDGAVPVVSLLSKAKRVLMQSPAAQRWMS